MNLRRKTRRSNMVQATSDSTRLLQSLFRLAHFESFFLDCGECAGNTGKGTVELGRAARIYCIAKRNQTGIGERIEKCELMLERTPAHDQPSHDVTYGRHVVFELERRLA